MDPAIYYPDNSRIYAKQVADKIQNDPSSRTLYRSESKNLGCPECEGNAWFRRGSRNGQAATFGAHHIEGCQLASSYPESDPGVLEASAPELTNEFKELSIRFTPLGVHSDAGNIRDRGPIEGDSGRTGRSHLAEFGEASSRTKHVELRSILGNLVTVHTYVEDLGELRINLPDREDVLPKDAFWSMSDFDLNNNSRIGKQLIVWGKVRTVNPKDYGVFFNQGVSGRNKGSILVSPEDITDLVNQYSRRGVQDVYDFSDGWFIIAIGRPEVTSNGLVYVKPQGDHVGFYLPRVVD